MIGADEMVLETGAGSVGYDAPQLRRMPSISDLEREFGSVIGELELGQGLRSGVMTVSAEAVPAWTRLFKFFH